MNFIDLKNYLLLLNKNYNMILLKNVPIYPINYSGICHMSYNAKLHAIFCDGR